MSAAAKEMDEQKRNQAIAAILDESVAAATACHTQDGLGFEMRTCFASGVC